ncbi:carboxy-S-adenosyl-L-methionine synthase CmoA [Pelagicoccus sp. NFK12]|uniref:Carboxy-S-adenosyl-L-methionine synthase n=1 Tax=Pelagicoccus enzymogenes TaxID=2773457 RepID=A0A927FAK2_9BACT|nr:carboxy-S-adenosyl-L-methionine synthase CmoA [Pelagicoccus enzymogenes]MBD5781344.1 carboxy-S-adenosyl-L-methionine synthase CmoA [Pelagicoccus enzymogenes]MDQ8199604.1 carboxy-S-adenosyl-L-methionine synthase CmoA [Pelagicoccus enzymogenes]
MPEPKANKDQVYADPRAQVAAFAFDERVADVFDDMIRRSVPGYGMTLSLLGIIAQHYAKPGTRIYDLGCSLGAGIASMGAQLTTPDVSFVGVDNSAAMLDRCRPNLATVEKQHTVELLCQDIQKTPIENASIVALNFTLQFIPKDERLELLTRIREGLAPGGILVLSEKILFDDPQIQADLTTLHHDFKRSQGYSDLEIAQKRAAIENVLVPETIDAHEARLSAAGFARDEIWLQCFNFASFLAFK